MENNLAIFNRLEDFLFGKETYYNNPILPENSKYWEKKNDSLIVPNLNWVNTLEEKLFFSIYKGSTLNLYVVLNEECKYLNKEPRTEYYKSEIFSICSELLSEVSEGLRLGRYSISMEILKRIRWYVFEAVKIEEKYKRQLLQTYINTGQIEMSDIISVCNYFTSLSLKWTLILVYRQISIIDNISLSDWKEDSFLKNILIEKFDTDTLKVLQEYTLKNLKNDVTHIHDLYIAIKNIYLNSYFSNEITSLNQLEVKGNLIKIENWVFTFMIIPNLIQNPVRYSMLDSIENPNKIFEEVYDEIRSEILDCDLPSDYSFVYQEKIDTVKEYLEMEQENLELMDLDSIPRKLLKKLELELQVVKANPQINLRAVFESKISPIKTSLSVSHLALLIRMLVDEKIIISINKAELFRTLSKVFQTKNQDAISENSLKNKFNVPEDTAIDFWDIKFNDFRDKVFDYRR
jgi:hypothetical protein